MEMKGSCRSPSWVERPRWNGKPDRWRQIAHGVQTNSREQRRRGPPG